MSSSPGRSARLKITSIGCGFLIVILRWLYFLNVLRLRPFGAWFVGGALASILVPVGIWFIVGRPGRRRRPTFDVDTDRSRFVIGPWPARKLYGMLTFAYGAMVTPVEHVPNTDRMRLSTVPGIVTMAAVLLGIMIAIGITLILVDRPMMYLDADGVTLLRFAGRRRRIAWDDIVAGSAMLEQRGRFGHRIVWQSADSGRSTFPAYGLQADPVFLLHAVRIYADLPERRPEAGTRAGLDRLRRERSDALAAAGLASS